MPLQYHSGQTSIQEQANTTRIAQKLAHWVGPIIDFAEAADLFLFALPEPNGRLSFSALAGQPPLVRFRSDHPLEIEFASGKGPAIDRPTPCGGLSIQLEQARRVRLNGTLRPSAQGPVLQTHETFTLCRKYMAPSVPLASQPHLGPVQRQQVPLTDTHLVQLVRGAETAFLATRSPDGAPDVAHRGGVPGFLKYDPVSAKLGWTEYVGDGIFKSAGNMRATGNFTLLVPDLATGDGIELVGKGSYTNHRTDRRQDPLVQHAEPFPVQGTIECTVTGAFRLKAVWHPRQRIEKARKITSVLAPHEQAPQ